MFCGPGLVFGGTEGVGSRFQVLRALTRFWRYRGRRVPFSCVALHDSFSKVPRASAPVFMFCAPGLIFGGTEGVRSRCFALLNSFSEVLSASGLVFTFCVPGLIFGAAECVGSRFHDLRARSRFRWYRGRRVPFSSFARSDSFSDVTECVGSRFHVLRARSHFRWYRWRLVPVYPWKISKINSWINENEYQLLIIKHKKGERERARERAHWSEKVANGLRSNFICPTRKFWAQNKEYKYPTILYPLGMSDSREDRERREISRVSPCDYIFSDKWDPPSSPL
jgi:hypothetical protein